MRNDFGQFRKRQNNRSMRERSDRFLGMTQQTTRRWVVGIGLAAGMLALGGCDLFYPSETIRYRMTVDVETPEGVRSGSSVLESNITGGTSFGDASGIQFDLSGEAVAVPLPNDKVLFALLRPVEGGDAGIYHANLMQSAACGEGRPSAQPDPALCGSAQWETFRPWAREQVLAAELYPSMYPMLVTVRDLTDPTSVQAANPGDFASVFGPGYALRRITVRVTDEEVTTGIERRLAWLHDHVGTLVRRLRNLSIGSMPEEHRITARDFHQGAR